METSCTAETGLLLNITSSFLSASLVSRSPYHGSISINCIYNLCSAWVSSFLQSSWMSVGNSQNTIGSCEDSCCFTTNLLNSPFLCAERLLKASQYSGKCSIDFLAIPVVTSVPLMLTSLSAI